MHISQNGLLLIERFEGFSSRPYYDPLGRVWTRGYGETEGIGPDSPPITRAQAQKRLQQLVEARYEPAIRALDIELNQNQWDALCSFAWNLGAGIFTGTLREALTRRMWTYAAQLMLAYDHAGGQVIPGLRTRRQDEARLFLTPVPPYVPADEARWTREYDQLNNKHTPWANTRRRALQRAMRKRLILILQLADHEPHGWKHLNREARYRALLARLPTPTAGSRA